MKSVVDGRTFFQTIDRGLAILEFRLRSSDIGGRYLANPSATNSRRRNICQPLLIILRPFV